MLNNVFTINHSNNTIQSSIFTDVIINKESLSYRSRISHTCCLNDDCIKCSLLLNQKLLDNFRKITPNSTTDASVHCLDNLLLRIDILFHKMIIDTDFTKLVLNNCNLEPMLCCKDVI